MPLHGRCMWKWSLSLAPAHYCDKILWESRNVVYLGDGISNMSTLVLPVCHRPHFILQVNVVTPINQDTRWRLFAIDSPSLFWISKVKSDCNLQLLEKVFPVVRQDIRQRQEDAEIVDLTGLTSFVSSKLHCRTTKSLKSELKSNADRVYCACNLQQSWMHQLQQVLDCHFDLHPEYSASAWLWADAWSDKFPSLHIFAQPLHWCEHGYSQPHTLHRSLKLELLTSRAVPVSPATLKSLSAISHEPL